MDQIFIVAGVMLVAMLTPGPDMILLMTNTWQKGRRQGIITAAGATTGLLIHIFLAVAGLTILIKSQLVFLVIKVLGALYIAYLGHRLYSSKSSLLGKNELFLVEGGSARQSFVQGFFCNVLNPKVMLFILGIFTHFLAKQSVESNLSLGIFLVLQNFLVWSLFVWLIGHKKIGGHLSRYEKIFSRVCGGLFLFMACKILLDTFI